MRSDESITPVARRGSFLKTLRLKLHPADRAIVAILLLAIITAACAGTGQDRRSLLFIHAILLAGYLIFLLGLNKWSRFHWLAYARPLVAMGVIWTLYCTLGWLGMAAMPFRADGALSRVDTWLFAGINPTFFVERWQTPARVEFFAFFYGLFIPYINLSLLLGSLGRPPVERDKFLTGWVFTYCISYVGYIFLPAQGPGGFLAGAYTVPLDGGYFYHVVVKSVADSGGLRGVFPSLHVASSLYLCLFDLRTHRLRGLTYLPIVALIYCATIVLRYHYVIDLIFGTMIAASCVRIGPWVLQRWALARSRAGLPALPGGDGDVLPDISSSGENVPPPVLSSN